MQAKNFSNSKSRSLSVTILLLCLTAPFISKVAKAAHVVGDVILHENPSVPEVRSKWSYGPHTVVPSATIAEWVTAVSGPNGRSSLALEVPQAAAVVDGSVQKDVRGSDIKLQAARFELHRKLDISQIRGWRTKISAHIRTEDVPFPPNPWEGIRLGLSFVTPDMSYDDAAYGIDNINKWHEVVHKNVRIPEDATETSLFFGLITTAGKMWIDDIRITLIEPPLSQLAAKRQPYVQKTHLRGSTGAAGNGWIKRLATEWHYNIFKRWLGFPSPNLPEKEYQQQLEKSLVELDDVMKQCEAAGLKLVIQVSVDGEWRNHKRGGTHRMYLEPAIADKFIKTWGIVATRYKGRKAVWAYDILNETTVRAQPAPGCPDWEGLAERSAKLINGIHPKAKILVQTEEWWGMKSFYKLRPINAKNVIYSAHMYDPFAVTHQGIEERKDQGFEYPSTIKGVQWDKNKLRDAIEPAVKFQQAYGVPMLVSEFSCIRWAKNGSQARWLKDVIELFEENGWDWTYHGMFDWDGWSVMMGEDPNNTAFLPSPGGEAEQVLRNALAKNLSSGVASVDAAEVHSVQDEKHKLPRPTLPLFNNWGSGAGLRQAYHAGPGSGLPIQRAVDVSSVVVRRGDRKLVEGTDYIYDRNWGVLALGPNPSIGPDDEVSVSYRYSPMRIDSLVRGVGGKEAVRKGESHLAVPRMPDIAAGETRLANIFVPANSDGHNLPLWPITETAKQARTLSTPGRLPRAMAKLAAGQPLKIVCWGDSVTVGAETTTGMSYTSVFARRMQEKFPKSKIDVKVVAIGGSNSLRWLRPAEFPYPGQQEHMDWDFVAREKPDVVTLEFVNDTEIVMPVFEQQYADILKRVKDLGAELVIITPHFVHLGDGDFAGMHRAENRPYVPIVREFAAKNKVAIADASSRWEHLWREGIPFITLLNNGYNHPDNRGHALFADELMKVFATDTAPSGK